MGTETLFRLSALNSAYASAIDSDRLETWPDFFVEDCLYKVTTADNHARNLAAGVIYADSNGMLRDRVFALRKANIYERQSYRHLIGMPLILSEDAGGIRSETPFFVARIMRDGSMSLFATGRYLDLVREDAAGALRFVERIVVCDSVRFDTLLAIPL
jgi:3-phenylpropionate/cinnamic acid dioxygenase small subunit